LNALKNYHISFYRWDYQREEDFIEESIELADIDVEGTGWSPIKGREPERLKIVFVDGIRNFHKAVYLEREKERGEGLFLTVCAGSLLLVKEGKRFSSEYAHILKERLFITNVSISGSIPVEWYGWSIEFKPIYVRSDPLNAIKQLLNAIEYKIIERSMELSPQLIMWDGTLRYNLRDRNLPVVGFIKKHLKYFLPLEESNILKDMLIGERTPIMLLIDREKDFNRYTWYVKVDEGGIASTIRIEAPEEIGIEKAKEIADWTAWLFPRIVSAPFTDKRYPHNVTPVKFLEKMLYREVGNSNIISRAIEVSLSELEH